MTACALRLAACGLSLLLVAPAAHAARRRHRKPAPKGPPPARVEDDPRKKGDDRAFARASLKFKAPTDLSQLDDGRPVEIRLEIAGYAIGALHPGGPVPHAHIIVDNEPAMQVDDVSLPLDLTGLQPGPHLVRGVLCRPWHEVVKAPHAFAMARFWLGPKLSGKAGKAAEFVAWPDPHKPILTYVLPIGVPSKDAPRLSLQGAAADPPVAERPVLDFYLANGRVARRGDKIRVVLDRRELPLLTEWKPHPLRRARRGTHKVSIDILNRKGLKVKNAVNRTDRVFTVK
ncbi:MAG: hypothetical protein ABR567_08225 [Myxococcales bacterium]